MSLPRLPSPDAFGADLGFVDFALDRMSARRDDPAFVAARRGEAGARALVLAGDAVVRGADGGVWHPLPAAEALGTPEVEAFLGRRDGVSHFALGLPAAAGEALASRGDPALGELRAMATGGLAPNADIGALAAAKALFHWHRTHRFCSACGQPSAAAAGGWRRECPACGTHHFPRTDPVVIMLAVDGDRCLLGRQARFPPGMVSCLAGFLEPGESIEDGVRRELQEEAGIETGYVTYLGSQPWPFPASVMLGCLAEAATTTLAVDTDELEDARWFTRDEARATLEGTHPDGIVCPRPMAIAHHILRAWVYREG